MRKNQSMSSILQYNQISCKEITCIMFFLAVNLEYCAFLISCHAKNLHTIGTLTLGLICKKVGNLSILTGSTSLPQLLFCWTCWKQHQPITGDFKVSNVSVHSGLPWLSALLAENIVGMAHVEKTMLNPCWWTQASPFQFLLLLWYAEVSYLGEHYLVSFVEYTILSLW